MKETVRPEDIKRFNELYHFYVRQNLASKSSVPDELKGLSAIDISVVNIVSSNPDIIIREIAEILNVPNSTLTSSLNRLEKKGIANRIISKRDKRSFGIELTDKGARVQQIHLEFERAYFERILAKLDTHEKQTLLLDLLQEVIYSNQNAENSKE